MTPREFITESNKIEGIFRDPTFSEIVEHERIMELPYLTTNDLIHFVRIYQPGAKLRVQPGMNVMVGSHIPPAGGPNIGSALVELLIKAEKSDNPYAIHVEYETLHPFTDCNGRSGRAVWAWMMTKLHGGYPLGFLHHFYYQSLKNARKGEWFELYREKY